MSITLNGKLFDRRSSEKESGRKQGERSGKKKGKKTKKARRGKKVWQLRY